MELEYRVESVSLLGMFRVIRTMVTTPITKVRTPVKIWLLNPSAFLQEAIPGKNSVDAGEDKSLSKSRDVRI